MGKFKIPSIGQVIDCLGKNMSRVKTIGLLILLILFFVSFINNGCNRNELSELVERITGINIENDLLQKDIQERDSLLLIKDIRIAAIKDSLYRSQQKTKQAEAQYSHLEAKYEDLAESLLKIPGDSSYSFLQDMAYPYEGEMKYPFNEPQVKGIHLTYLEKISLDDMNENLKVQISGCKDQLIMKDDIATEVEGKMMLMKETRRDLEKTIDNKDEVIEIKDKQIKDEHRGKVFWKITTGIASFIAIIIAL